MSLERVNDEARRILGPGNLYSPGCEGWFWLKEDGTTVYLGFLLSDAHDALEELERQASSDGESPERAGVQGK